MEKFFYILFLVIILININLISSQEYSLKVTEEHPFLMNGEWVTASQLKVGDSLTTADGKKAKITSIGDVVLEDGAVDVYNLETEDYLFFFSGAALIA